MAATPSVPPPPIVPPTSQPIVANTSSTKSFPPTPIPTRPKPGVPLKKIAIIALTSFILLIIVLLAVSLLRRRQGPTSPQSPSIPGSQVTISPTTPPQDVPSQTTERLPLTTLAGHQLIGISETSTTSQFWLIEFTKEGPRKSQFYSLDGRVGDMALSPNKQMLAFSFYPPKTGEPAAGFKVYDFRDKSVTEFISPSDRLYSYPSWSGDNLYLSVWGRGNDGDSNPLFDMTTKRRLLDIGTTSDGKITPLIFVPNQPKIAYIENGMLYESEYSGEKKTLVAQSLNTITQNGNPDIPLYSQTARFVVFHNSLGQLVLLDKTDSNQQILAEGDPGQDSPIVFGYPLFFDPSENILYLNQKKDSYSPGIDDNPLNFYNPFEKKNTPFFANPKTPVVTTSILPGHSKNKLLLHMLGFSLFTTSGELTSNCDYTKFSYSYPGHLDTLPLFHISTLLSPDDKYLYAATANIIADTSTCAVSGPIDTQSFVKAIWLK